MLLGLAISAHSILFSQTAEQFVEVIVEDSISVAPDQVIFSLHILPWYESPAVDSVQSSIEVHERRVASIAKQLEDLIKAQEVERIPIKSWVVYSGYEQMRGKLFAQIRFKSSEKLQHFITAANNIRGVYGYISSSSSSKKSQYIDELYKRLIKKAKEDATSIARYSDRKLGNIAHVEEQDPNSGGRWTAYPPIGPLGAEDILVPTYNVIFYKKLAVRFGWQAE